MANFKICPVVNLSNTSANCSIKVRLVGKGYLRSIRTGGGKFFKMELQDASGVIDATSYGDKFFDMLEVGKVFLIRNFEVKNAHEEYNNLNHQYEIKFTSSTQIDQWSDEGVPEITYNFVEISQVANVGFDLIGVCHNVGEIQPCGQRQKRLLTLVDRSMAAVDVEVWNEEAAKFDNNQHPVVIVKTGRYNEYFRTVSTNNALIIDPDIEKANVLKSWYSKGGSANISSNLNISSGIPATQTHNAQIIIPRRPDVLRCSPLKGGSTYIYNYINVSSEIPATQTPDVIRSSSLEGESTYIFNNLNVSTNNRKAMPSGGRNLVASRSAPNRASQGIRPYRPRHQKQTLSSHQSHSCKIRKNRRPYRQPQRANIINNIYIGCTCARPGPCTCSRN